MHVAPKWRLTEFKLPVIPGGGALNTGPFFTQNWGNMSTCELHQSIALHEYSRLVASAKMTCQYLTEFWTVKPYGNRESRGVLNTGQCITQNRTNISPCDLHQSIALDEYSRLVPWCFLFFSRISIQTSDSVVFTSMSMSLNTLFTTLILRQR